jgi:hypothetical protein
MKSILAAFSSIVLSAVLFSSCAKEDYNSGNGQTGYNPFGSTGGGSTGGGSTGGGSTSDKGVFTAKVNGSGFTASSSSVDQFSGGSIVIIGYQGSGFMPEKITLNLSNPSVGTYAVSSSGVIVAYTASGSTAVSMGTSGEVVISEKDDTRIKGTFNFVAGSINITEGQFDLKINK